MKQLKIYLHFWICSILLFLPTVSASDMIVLMADEWCPYNCEPEAENPGFMIEIAREALEPFGHDIDYQTLNWARSLHRAELGEINGVIGAVPDEAPDFIFGPPIGTYVDVIAFRAGEAIDASIILDQNELRLGTINGYTYYGLVEDYIALHSESGSLVQSMSGDDALEKNLRKLLAGRLDMVAEVRAVLEYTLATSGSVDLASEVDLTLTDDVGDIFIAFSPMLPTSQTYADQLIEGVARLRESGRYSEIMLKYGQQVD